MVARTLRAKREMKKFLRGKVNKKMKSAEKGVLDGDGGGDRDRDVDKQSQQQSQITTKRKRKVRVATKFYQCEHDWWCQCCL